MKELTEMWKGIVAYLLAVAVGAWSIMIISIPLVGHPEWSTPSYIFVGMGEFFLLGVLTTLPFCVFLFWRTSQSIGGLTVRRGLGLGAIGAGGAWLLLFLFFSVMSGVNLKETVGVLPVGLVVSAIAAVGGAMGGAAYAAIKKRFWFQ